jgi:hypothetical protein
MDYETLLNAIGEEPEYLFKTERGSSYAHYPDNSTVRNRSGAGHRDTTEGLQPRSGKTIYMDPRDVDKVAGLFQNPELGTAFKPTEYDKETKSGKAALTFTEDFGPKKAGTVVQEVTFTTVPRRGYAPVEINRSESPVGDTGRGIHWGTTITEVLAKDRGRSGGSPARVPMGGGAPSTGAKDLHSLNPLALYRAVGGPIPMPNTYSQGGWKLI